MLPRNRFKKSRKSPYDESGPNATALRRSLEWLEHPNRDIPSPETSAEIRKRSEQILTEPPEESAKVRAQAEPEADPSATENNETEKENLEAKPDSEESTQTEAAPVEAAQPDKTDEITLDSTDREEAMVTDLEDSQIAGLEDYLVEQSEIRAASRPPRNPLINSRRLRRVDDDDPAKPSRHRRRCIICRHDDMHAIEQAFLEWRRPNDIKYEFQLPNRMCLYRHARATGLFEKRARNLRFALEKVIEESTCRPPSADSIIRAVRVYGCLDSIGRWVEPPRQLIISYNHSRPEGAPKKLLSAGPATPRKRLISVDPAVIEAEKGA